MREVIERAQEALVQELAKELIFMICASYVTKDKLMSA